MRSATFFSSAIRPVSRRLLRFAASRLDADETVNLAHRFLRKRRNQANLVLLERGVERFPDHAEIRLLYATALMQYQPERVAWEAASAVALDSHDADRLVRAAWLLYALDETDAARSYAERAQTLAPVGFALTDDLRELQARLSA